MRQTRLMKFNKQGVICFLGAMILGLAAWMAVAAEPPKIAQPVITSIRSEGTNVVLAIAVPLGLGQVTLEMRPSLDTKWDEMGLLDVPQEGGAFTFTLPKPDKMQFFRLKAKPLDAEAVVLSSELRYVTIPPLGPEPGNTNQSAAAIFHFKGVIDGSDRIVISKVGALWDHVNWDWPPGMVEVNGVQWNPQEKNYLTTAGSAKFLDDVFALDSAELQVIRGRDVVAMEKAGDVLIVYMDDVQGGADEYEFEVRFHRAVQKAPKPAGGTVATLKIAAQIDGSDLLVITANEATLRHEAYQMPDKVMLNNVEWLPGVTEVLKNEGTNTFLPAGIDFSTAKIVGRKGRDLATMWSVKDMLWVRFADNPNGSDAYELELSFGK